ncbi:LacI family transcriptional regulator [Leucobacter luti]|uniref:LacI family transcriptional regulator n=1 Tax=Leucobacter luti TaxID=340320 RepID=A0A4V3CY96_9MICO|nr:LacI family DNA-binding transcriptional regulator [Leucobacter luti]TDP93298.1 LacI family transcriptional regulator [Leucobacter luti]
MGNRPTIYDVAARAGVSKSLVSLVLQGSPRVRPDKRAAVLEAVAALGYSPSRLAAGLAGSQTRSIGVVIDEFENLWFAPVLEGIRAALADARYSLSVTDARLNAHLGLDSLEAFRALRVDGVILAGEASEEALTQLGVPVVVLGTRAVSVPGVPVVASDEFAGGRLAAAHLAKLGHREVLCVSAPGASAAAREAGCVAELRERGLSVRVVHAAQTSGAAAGAAVAELLEGPEARRPTAVFAVNDPMALGVMGAAARLGLSVPRDLSVLGYDDSPLAEYELISLTSISGDPRELGEAAGSELLAVLGGGDAPAETLLQPRLVQRGSTAPR